MYTKNIKPSIATKDIVAYKVLYRNNKGVLYSPLMNYRSRLNTLLENNTEIRLFAEYGDVERVKEVLTDTTAKIWYKTRHGYSITFGVFHLFHNKEDAINFMKDLYRNPYNSKYFRLYKAIIPAGTQYYSGTAGYYVNAPKTYGARKVIYKRMKQE